MGKEPGKTEKGTSKLKRCKYCGGFIRADFFEQHVRAFHSDRNQETVKAKKGWVKKTCSECGESYLGRKNYGGVPICLDCGEDIFEAEKRNSKRKPRKARK